MRSFRKLIDVLLPYWARDDEAGGAFAYVLAALVDVSLEHVRAGLEARFPSRAGEAALALLGGDRLIERGRDETAAHYAARLAAWRYPRGHRVRGSVFALLEQISEYFGGLALYGIDASGNKRARALDGTETATPGTAWTWDTLPASAWARQWVVIDGSDVLSAQRSFGDALLWGGALGTDGYCIGMQGASAEDWRAVVRLTRGQHRWLPAGTRGEWIVVSFDGSEPAPDATWEKWGKLDGADYVPSRSGDFRYVAFRDAAHEYAGDDDWANQAVTTLGTFAGDDTDYPLTITTPQGDYAGTQGVFPATITLPDDGSFPA